MADEPKFRCTSPVTRDVNIDDTPMSGWVHKTSKDRGKQLVKIDTQPFELGVKNKPPAIEATHNSQFTDKIANPTLLEPHATRESLERSSSGTDDEITLTSSQPITSQHPTQPYSQFRPR